MPLVSSMSCLAAKKRRPCAVAMQIIGSEIFEALKKKYGEERFLEFMKQKVVAIPGNIVEKDLALAPADAKMLMERIDVIVNSAATTKFDERYVNVASRMLALRLRWTCILYGRTGQCTVNGSMYRSTVLAAGWGTDVVGPSVGVCCQVRSGVGTQHFRALQRSRIRQKVQQAPDASAYFHR